MRLGLVSAKYPYGPKEPYLDAELRALAPHFEGVAVFPVSPDTAIPGFAAVPAEVVRLSLAGPRTFALAAAAFVRRPLRVARTLATLLRERYPARAKLKNLVVFPKGLALAELARRRRLDHLHAYWLSTPATVAWIASQVARIPFSATAHRWDIYENNLAARKLADAAFVRTISARGRADLLARTGADPGKVRLVRLGVTLPPRAASRASGAPLRILCAAAFVPVKGHAVLVSALAQLRGRGVAFVCTLAGDGPLREEIAARIAAAGLNDDVRLAGTIPHDELLERLARGEFDVSVIASIEGPDGLMEGVPVALLEAMAAGAVVVATDSGSISEAVEDGVTGLLVRPSDPTALAGALERAGQDSAMRERLREAARTKVEEEFDLARTSARLRALFVSV